MIKGLLRVTPKCCSMDKRESGKQKSKVVSRKSKVERQMTREKNGVSSPPSAFWGEEKIEGKEDK